MIIEIHFQCLQRNARRQRVVDLYLSNTAYVNNWDLVYSSAHKILGSYVFARAHLGNIYVRVNVSYL